MTLSDCRARGGGDFDAVLADAIAPTNHHNITIQYTKSMWKQQPHHSVAVPEAGPPAALPRRDGS